MNDRNRDPGAPLDSEGIPDHADDASPERDDVPEPQRPATPTEAPVVSTDFGTTAAEQRAGQPLERKLARETRDEVADPLSNVDEADEYLDDLDRSAKEHSPYEREIPPAERDLAEHETLPGGRDLAQHETLPGAVDSGDPGATVGGG